MGDTIESLGKVQVYAVGLLFLSAQIVKIE